MLNSPAASERPGDLEVSTSVDSPDTRGDPLTYSQESRLHAFQVVGKNRNTRSCSCAVRLTGKLDEGALHDSVDALIERHEALRSHIRVVNGIPRQTTAMQRPTLERIDLPGCEQNRVRMFIEQLVNEPVNMEVDPLFVCRSFRTGSDETILIVSVDHIMADGESLRLMMREILGGYLCRGLLRSPHPRPLQQGEYSRWQRNAQTQWLAEHGNYWTRKLSQPVNDLQTSGIQSIGAAPKWGERALIIDGNTRVALSALCRRAGATLAIGALAIYAMLLSEMMGRSRVAIGVLTSGRARREARHSVGFFASTLYIDLEVDPCKRFLDILGRVAAEYAASLEHHDYGLLAFTKFGVLLARAPSFNWNSGVQRAVASPMQAGPENKTTTRIQPFEFSRTWPELGADDYVGIYGGDPWVVLTDLGTHISGSVKFRTARFSVATMHRFAQRFRQLATACVSGPNMPEMQMPYWRG